MLIGLGVDYSLHLTGRYREELVAGRSVDEAVSIPPRTVGRALVLVTLTTMIGFLANVVSPAPDRRLLGVHSGGHRLHARGLHPPRALCDCSSTAVVRSTRATVTYPSAADPVRWRR